MNWTLNWGDGDVSTHLGHGIMRHLAAGCAAIALLAATDVSNSVAETPADTLVQAWQIDDLITLDPAEIFEFAGAEYGAQVYDRLVTYPVDDVENLQGHVAETWEIGEDGRTYTFKIRDGITFHSGNALTAEDAAWSLQRVIKLNKTPSFILSQFGFTPENADEMITAVDDRTLEVTLDQPGRVALRCGVPHPIVDNRLQSIQELQICVGQSSASSRNVCANGRSSRPDNDAVLIKEAFEASNINFRAVKYAGSQRTVHVGRLEDFQEMLRRARTPGRD